MHIPPVGDVPHDPQFRYRFRVEHPLSSHPLLSLKSVAGRVWLSDLPDVDADRAVGAMYGGGHGSCDRLPKTTTVGSAWANLRSVRSS